MELASDINSAFHQNLESKDNFGRNPSRSDNFQTTENISSSGIAVDSSDGEAKAQSGVSRETLGLLLSCQLAELHGGDITIQGSPESGYRYVLSLPLDQGSAEVVQDTNA